MITLFTAATGNGYRVSILLEELGLPYRAVAVGFEPGAVRTADFLAASPLAKIPAIVDPDTDCGEPIALSESLAIALYLTEKTGRLVPATAAERAAAWQWAAIVVSGFGAAIPGIFFARRLGAEAHAAMIEKYVSDLDGYFTAMDGRLARVNYLAGAEFRFVDALAAPLLPTARAFGIDLTRFENIERWEAAVFARPGVQRGMKVTGEGP